MGTGKKQQNDENVKISMNKKIMLVIFIVFFVLSPLIVSTLISIKILDNVANDWIGFYGNYFGTFISICLSLYILFVNKINNDENIKQTNNENEKNQKLLMQTNQDIINNSVRPVINAWHIEGEFGQEFRKGKKFYDYALNDNRIFVSWIDFEGRNQKILGRYFSTELAIENVGVGPAINLEVQFISEGIVFISNNRVTINKDGCIIYRIFIYHNVLKDLINTIVFKYQDIYGNKYKQDISFGTNNKDGYRTLNNFNYVSIQERDV